jgi:hypothetical protein
MGYTHQITYEKFHEQLGAWVQDGYRTTPDTIKWYAKRLKERAKLSRQHEGPPFGGQVRNVRIVRINRRAK